LVPDLIIESLDGPRQRLPIDAKYKLYDSRKVSAGDVYQSFIQPPAVAASAHLVTATDWFVGYLLVDALIGNTDRHHENWAVLESIGLSERCAVLAPSYDHASSLGRELTDDERRARLDGKDGRRTVEAYTKKARSALYRSVEDSRPMSPIDAFAEALGRTRHAGKVWL
jgi:hypothetical protein